MIGKRICANKVCIHKQATDKSTGTKHPIQVYLWRNRLFSDIGRRYIVTPASLLYIVYLVTVIGSLSPLYSPQFITLCYHSNEVSLHATSWPMPYSSSGIN